MINILIKHAQKFMGVLLAALLVLSAVPATVLAEDSLSGWFVNRDGVRLLHLDGEGTATVVRPDGTVEECEYEISHGTVFFEIDDRFVDLDIIENDALDCFMSYYGSILFGYTLYREDTEPSEKKDFYDPKSGLAVTYSSELNIVEGGMTSDEAEIVCLGYKDSSYVMFFSFGEQYEAYLDEGMSYEEILETFINSFIDDYLGEVFDEDAEIAYRQDDETITHYGAEYDTDDIVIAYAGGGVSLSVDDAYYEVYVELTNAGEGVIFFSAAIYETYDNDALYYLNNAMYNLRYDPDNSSTKPSSDDTGLSLELRKKVEGKVAFVFSYGDGPLSHLSFELLDEDDQTIYSYITVGTLSETEGTYTISWNYKLADGTFAKSGDTVKINYWTDETTRCTQTITLP